MNLHKACRQKRALHRKINGYYCPWAAGIYCPNGVVWKVSNGKITDLRPLQMEALVFWSKSFRGISLLWIFSYLFTTGAFNIGTNWCLGSKKSCLVCDSGELNNAFVLRASGSYAYTKSEYPQAPFVNLDVFIGKWGNLFNYWPEMNGMRMKLHFFPIWISVPVSSSICWYREPWIIIPEFQSSFWIITSGIHSVASYLHQNGDLRFVKQMDCILRALKNGSMT